MQAIDVPKRLPMVTGVLRAARFSIVQFFAELRKKCAQK
jgi:hypothetical protein